MYMYACDGLPTLRIIFCTRVEGCSDGNKVKV